MRHKLTSDKWIFDCFQTGRDAEVMEFLTRQPEYLHLRDSDGATLLHHCARSNSLPLAQFLLNHGLSPNLRTHENRTPLHDSFEHGTEAISKILLENGAEVDIHYAAAIGDLETLAMFLDKCPDMLFDVSTGLTLLDWAAFGNSDDAIRLLNDRGLDVNFRTQTESATALMAAAQYNHCKAARALLELGCDPNLSTHEGFTPLHYAATMRYASDTTPVTAMMLAYDAEVNTRAKQDLTPLGVLEKTRSSQPDATRNYEGLQALLAIHGAVL